jgi:hypothetical protein
VYCICRRWTGYISAQPRGAHACTSTRVSACCHGWYTASARVGTSEGGPIARVLLAIAESLSVGKQGPDGSTTFSFDTGDGKPPKPKASASASAGKAASAQAARADGDSMTELEKQMAAAWEAAGAR